MRKRKKIKRKSVNYADGEVVFEEGSDGRECYFIISGKAEVSQCITKKNFTGDLFLCIM